MYRNTNTTYSQDLWKKIQQGDMKALSLLFENQYLKLFNYGCKIINTEVLVEDAIQDIFISIWRGHKKLADVSSVESYLIISLRRRLLRLIEKERKISNRINQITPEITFVPEEFQTNDGQDDKMHELLIEALNKLPDRRKEALYLHFYNGMDYEEISQIMDLNIQTVRNYVSHAVMQVREILNSDKIPHIIVSLAFLILIRVLLLP